MGGGDRPRTDPSGWARAPRGRRELQELQEKQSPDGAAHDWWAQDGRHPHRKGAPAEDAGGAGAQACECHRGLGQSTDAAAEGTRLSVSSQTGNRAVAEHTLGLTDVTQLPLQLDECKGVG